MATYSMFPLPKSHWVPDGAVMECLRCNEKFPSFSLFTRKHHCRSCGNVFCGDCTNYQRKGHKVCYECGLQNIQITRSIWKGSICVPSNGPFQSIYQLCIRDILPDMTEFRGSHTIGTEVTSIRGRWNRLENGQVEVIITDRDITLRGFIGMNTFTGDVIKEGYELEVYHTFNLEISTEQVEALSSPAMISGETFTWESPSSKAVVLLGNKDGHGIGAGILVHYVHPFADFKTYWVLTNYCLEEESPVSALCFDDENSSLDEALRLELQPKMGYIGNENLDFSMIFVSHKRNIEIFTLPLIKFDHEIYEEAELVIFQHPHGSTKHVCSGTLRENLGLSITYDFDSLYKNSCSIIFHKNQLLGIGLGGNGTLIDSIIQSAERLPNFSRICVMKCFRPTWKKLCYVSMDSHQYRDVGCRTTYTEGTARWIVDQNNEHIQLRSEFLHTNNWMSIKEIEDGFGVFGSEEPVEVSLVNLGLGFYFFKINDSYVGLNTSSVKTLAGMVDPGHQFCFGIWGEVELNFRLIFRLDTTGEVVE